MKLSTQQAADLANKSRTTIWRACKKGKLSAELSDTGEYLIDPAELERAYGPLKREEPLRSDTEEHDATPKETSETKLLQQKLEFLEEQLETARSTINKLEEDKKDLREERDRLLSVIDKQTDQVKMLTDQSEAARNKASDEQDQKMPWWWPFGRGRTAAES